MRKAREDLVNMEEEITYTMLKRNMSSQQNGRWVVIFATADR